MSTRERPTLPLPPTAAQVPPELRSLPRWVGWKCVWDEAKGKFRKPPHSPVTGEGVGPVAKNAAHFLTFDEARAGVEKLSLDGIGFVFVREDGFVGIDFDDCRTVDGTIHPDVVNLLKWFPTYTEISPSGTGIHVIGRGKLAKAVAALPLGAPDGPKVELYSGDRYFTVTGISP